jgi:hypothetical protein
MTRVPSAIVQTGTGLVCPILRTEVVPLVLRLRDREVKFQNHLPTSTLFDPVLTSLRV